MLTEEARRDVDRDAIGRVGAAFARLARVEHALLPTILDGRRNRDVKTLRRHIARSDEAAAREAQSGRVHNR